MEIFVFVKLAKLCRALCSDLPIGVIAYNFLVEALPNRASSRKLCERLSIKYANMSEHNIRMIVSLFFRDRL